MHCRCINYDRCIGFNRLASFTVCFVINLVPNYASYCVCLVLGCKHVLMKVIFWIFRFGRVLPLPSENWQEICGNVFCHGDSTLPTSDALSPKSDDCFTSDSDYVLHSSLLENEIQVNWYTDVHLMLCN